MREGRRMIPPMREGRRMLPPMRRGSRLFSPMLEGRLVLVPHTTIVCRHRNGLYFAISVLLNN